MIRRLLWLGGGLLLGLVGLRFYLLATIPDLRPPASMKAAAATNPLPPCPDTPNCARTTRTSPLSPEELFLQAQAALQHTGADSVRVNPNTHRIDAVYRVFVFKDDVAVAITPQDQGSAVHIRSASRVGHSDWGVNARRVATILGQLEGHLHLR